jgi:hypothetical protein
MIGVFFSFGVWGGRRGGGGGVGYVAIIKFSLILYCIIFLIHGWEGGKKKLIYILDVKIFIEAQIEGAVGTTPS